MLVGGDAFEVGDAIRLSVFDPTAILEWTLELPTIRAPITSIKFGVICRTWDLHTAVVI